MERQQCLPAEPLHALNVAINGELARAGPGQRLSCAQSTQHTWTSLGPQTLHDWSSLSSIASSRSCSETLGEPQFQFFAVFQKTDFFLSPMQLLSCNYLPCINQQSVSKQLAISLSSLSLSSGSSINKILYLDNKY